MKQVDVLIVGQGLSGSLLALELVERGKSVLVIDSEDKNSASKVAIGLVNPITGKRLVKSWMIDELLPFATRRYQQLETLYNKQFLHFTELARIIPNEDIFEQWQSNFQSAVEENYINPKIQTVQFGNKQYRYFNILNTFWLNTVALLSEIKKDLQSQNAYKKSEFHPSALKLADEYIYDEKVKAEHIVLCTGAKALTNSFFADLPFNLNKGEVIDVHLTDYQFQEILKKNIFIVPDKNMYRIGSTYNHSFTDDLPSEKALTYFRKKVREITGKEFELLSHQAAVRPSTIDRRPFIGSHAEQKNLHIFNGFGTKGVSLIPYFASHFCDYLLHNIELNPEVDVERFV